MLKERVIIMSNTTKDIFKTNIFNSIINPPNSSNFNLVGTKLPSNQDIYFISKWHELFDRYCSARLFIREALKDEWSDWQHWFNLTEDVKINKAFKLKFIAEMYETALIYYNILVDLSWTITYVSSEYVLYRFDGSGNIINHNEIYGMQPIEQAYEALRNAENNVTSPTAANNPFKYLKEQCPRFENSIDLIIEFWSSFSNSEIRGIYNYIKHKGKPVYYEINELSPVRFFDLHIGNEQYPSDIRDVQKILRLYDSISMLINFDDNELFPYLTQLLSSLKSAINPSPMVF